jgi:hypothetical protein
VYQDTFSKEVISTDVTTGDVNYSEMLPELLTDASMNRNVIKAFINARTRGEYQRLYPKRLKRKCVVL